LRPTLYDRHHTVRRGALLGGVLAALAAGPAAGQAVGEVSFVGGLGYTQGSPGPGLVDGLDALGLGDTRAGQCYGTVCVDGVDHPFYHDEGLDIAALAGVRYRAHRLLSLEALISNGQRGHAEGYNAETREHMVVAYASLLLSTTVNGHLGPFHLEAGPAVSTTGWRATRNSTTTIRSRSWALGTTVGAGVSVPFQEVVLTLRAAVRRFPHVELEVPSRQYIEADYRALIVGITATPLHD
jgi:hypothetical protein